MYFVKTTPRSSGDAVLEFATVLLCLTHVSFEDSRFNWLDLVAQLEGTIFTRVWTASFYASAGNSKMRVQRVWKQAKSSARNVIFKRSKIPPLRELRICTNVRWSLNNENKIVVQESPDTRRGDEKFNDSVPWILSKYNGTVVERTRKWSH